MLQACPIANINTAEILVEERDYIVAYKPPRMHSSPLAKSTGENILDYCVALFPEIAHLKGRRMGEGGLIHRLDYETQVLVLLARNQDAMNALLIQQEEGEFVKYYSAVVSKAKEKLPGFPQLEGPTWLSPNRIIASAFRPYGVGRKAVRPLTVDTSTNIAHLTGGVDNNVGKNSRKRKKESALNKGAPYITEIVEIKPLESFLETALVKLKLQKGFRHQVRCHLAWLGFPILNDELYGGTALNECTGEVAFLALRASTLSFNDPVTGKKLSFVGEWGFTPLPKT
jgi:23S rRNA pseudouridine1911/1915/1917 synthase